MANMYTSAVQDHVALIVHNNSYDNLKTEQKLLQDNNWTTGEPGGHAGDAQTKIRRYANYLLANGLDDAPSDWTQWFKWEIACNCAAGVKPERAQEYRRQRDESMVAALQTYSRVDASDATDSDGQINTTFLSIRRYVMANCVRLSPPFFAQPELIDGALKASLYTLWNMSEWSWRVVNSLTFALDTSGKTQTITVSTPVSQLYSNRLYFDGTNHFMVHSEPDRMQHDLSRGLDSGRPESFRISRDKSAGTLKILLDRTPDQSYTVRGDFLAKCPDLSTFNGDTGNQTDLIGLVPDDFLDVLKRMTLCRVLMDAGRREGYAMKGQIDDDLSDLSLRDKTGNHVKEGDYSSGRGVILDQHFMGGGVIGGGV